MEFPRNSRPRRYGATVAAGLAAMALVLTACDAPTTAGSGESKGQLIGASLYTQQVARFNFEEKLMRETAAKNGDQFISNFANGNLETQISQLQSLMQRGIKVLILNQINSKAFAPIVN